MINCNPETVSTDFDTSDRLYFEPLDEESVRDVLENEGLAEHAGDRAVRRADGDQPRRAARARRRAASSGSSAETIDLAEDRGRFEAFLDDLGIPQPPGGAVTTVEDALEGRAADRLPGAGPPVLRARRPGDGDRPQRERAGRATSRPPPRSPAKRPILVDKYLEGKEVEVDAICDGERRADPRRHGAHRARGRAQRRQHRRLPWRRPSTPRKWRPSSTTRSRIGRGLGVRGPDERPVRDLRGRGLRARGQPARQPHGALPLEGDGRADGERRDAGHARPDAGRAWATRRGLWPRQRLFAIKAPVFSMAKLVGVDTYLGPEMKSTGEVMGIDRRTSPALKKCLMAARASLPPPGNMLLSHRRPRQGRGAAAHRAGSPGSATASTRPRAPRR